MKLNRVQTLKTFFAEPPIKMDEMKALSKEDRVKIADMCKEALIKAGTHKEEDFDFTEPK